MKNKTISKQNITFLTFLILISVLSCKSKQLSENQKEVNYIPYYLEVYKADSLRIIGKNKEAFVKLDSLFKIYKPLNQIYLYEMSNYVRLAELEKRKENIRPVLENLIKDWGLNKEKIEKDSLIALAVQRNKISAEEIKNWETVFQSKLNNDYQAKMGDIRAKDQAVRKSYDDPDAIRLVDDNNYVEFSGLLNKYGYPTYQKIGMPLSVFLMAFYPHIANASSDFEKNKKLLMKYVKSGEASPMHIFSLIDGKYVHQHKVFFFGDDGIWTGVVEIQKVPKDTIENRRKQYGLPSLEYAIWKRNQ
ncbi:MULTISPECIES: hypothetical protein [Chryseobacterium]|uniref:hypothetical protein n=1 Tax=Chryseobacterium sp. R2A-55 TaxID=2744445 RepID=UPI001F1A2384|nr:hypothetical protein [Chryseobacterium sp. R2A-55]